MSTGITVDAVVHVTKVIGICTIIAIIVGPLLALQAQKWLESWKEKRERKLMIFRALMATRAIQSKTTFEHVRALNMVDVEFYGYKEILDTWDKYVRHLNDQTVDPKDKGAIERWARVGGDIFTDLLMAMAKELNYEFSVDHLKRQTYVPKAHGDLLEKQQLLMQGVQKVLDGSPLSVQLIDKKEET